MVKLKEASIIKERENFFSQIKKIRVTLSSMFSDFTDVYIADSTPIVICKISRANRSAIRTTDEIKHSFGCRIAHKSRFFGYKLHAVCNRIIELTLKGVIDRDMTYDEYLEDKKIKELQQQMYS